MHSSGGDYLQKHGRRRSSNKILSQVNMSSVRKRTVLAAIVTVCLLGICVTIFFSWASHHRKSLTGHLLRRLQGESGVTQAVSDLADDVRQTPFLNKLQNWSMETLSNYNSGNNVADRTITPNLPLRNVVVSPSVVPQFLRNKWQDQPEVALYLSTNRLAESVVLDWYNYGLVIGPTNYSMKNFELAPYYIVTVSPGVFAMWFASK